MSVAVVTGSAGAREKPRPMRRRTGLLNSEPWIRLGGGAPTAEIVVMVMNDRAHLPPTGGTR